MKKWTLALIIMSSLLVFSTGCSDTSGPDVEANGTLLVKVTTSGADKDVDGYTLANNQLPPVADSVKKAGSEEYLHEEEISLNIGQQEIELMGVADNCEVSGENPRMVDISEDQVAETLFEVSCSSQIEGDVLFVSDDNPLFEESNHGTSTLYEGLSLNTGNGVNSQNSKDALDVIISSDVDLITPAASSDGRIYTWGRRGQGLAITKDGGTTTSPFTDSSGDAEPAFSPDDSQIAFTSERTGDKEIFVKPIDGTQPAQNLTNSPDTDDYAAAWSPDGTKLAFTRSGQGDCKAQVVIMDMASGETQPLTDRCGTFSGYPTWSPDGKELVILRENDSGALNLYITAVDGSGGEWQTIYNSGRLDKQAYPCWSPDGYIYYTSVGQTNRKMGAPTMQATSHNASRSNRSQGIIDNDIFDTDADVRHITCPAM